MSDPATEATPEHRLEEWDVVSRLSREDQTALLVSDVLEDLRRHGEKYSD